MRRKKVRRSCQGPEPESNELPAAYHLGIEHGIQVQTTATGLVFSAFELE
jgi:hypothetical protein